MNLDYLVDIHLDGSSGKEKGSKEKAVRLARMGETVRIWSLKGKKRGYVARLCAMLWLESRYLISTLFARKKPDVVFTRSHFAFGSWAIGRIYRSVVVREVHTDMMGEFRLLYSKKRFLLPLLSLFNRYNLYFIKRADGVIFNNTQLEEYYVSQYGLSREKTITVPNGCDTRRFYPVNKLHARKHCSLEAGKKYMLFIGSVSKWHGVEYLLKIQDDLSRRRNDIVLLIVGGHALSEANELKKKYPAGNTVYSGRVDYEKALMYINAADVCLVPVHNVRVSPGSPIKLYDAVACGKPVITQIDTPGYSDITEEYSLGISCDFTHTKEASEQIATFLDTADYDHYQKHNREVAVRHLEWDIMMGRWIKFAQKLMDADDPG